MSTFYDDTQTSDESVPREEPDGEEEEEDDEEYEILAKTFKIIIIGDCSVGKTCLAYRFCTGKFPERTETTIGVDFWEKCLELNGEPVKLQLWDTAGQERFRKSMVVHYYRNVSAAIFMYDITRMSSFEALTMWLQEYSHHAYGRDVPKILIGNKCDLGSERVVSSNIARKFADCHNMPLWEISTKNDAELHTIESILLTLTHKLIKHKPLMDRERTKTSGEDSIETHSKKGTRRRKRQSKRIKLKHQTSREKKKCCNSS